MAGPSFKPGQYEKLGKSQKMVYWVAVILGFSIIAGVWIYKFSLMG